MPNHETHLGDCLEVLRRIPSNSISAVICDPPYGLSDHSPDEIREALRCWLDGKPYTPKGKRGFMGANWDAFVPGPEVWRECARVLKPGGHLLVFAGTRTQDLMGMAVRLGGFDARDTIEVTGIATWLHPGFPKSKNVALSIDKSAGCPNRGRAIPTASTHLPDGRYQEEKLTGNHVEAYEAKTEAAKPWEGWGTGLKPAQEPVLVFRKPVLEPCSLVIWAHGQGFPKSLDVSKVIDKREGAVREVIGTRVSAYGDAEGSDTSDGRNLWGKESTKVVGVTGGAVSEAAKTWEGWGTALKPSQEPVLVFRKPLEGTVAENVLKYGTGAMNIDGCRVGVTDGATLARTNKPGSNGWKNSSGGPNNAALHGEPSGRWPPNLVLVHSPGCRRVGTRTVTAPTINRFNDGMKPFGDGAGHPYTSTGGGTEETPVYECQDGCPVKALDDQSGELHPRGNQNPSSGGGGMYGHLEVPTLHHERPELKEVGGASRYFPQFEYSPEDAVWECAPDCPVKALDDQSGIQKDGAATSRGGQNGYSGGWGAQEYSEGGFGYGGEGGASRYFPQFGYNQEDNVPFHYCAKASSSERNEGCEGLVLKERALREDGRFNSGGRTQVDGNWVETGSTPLPTYNNHPTVKPISLMRWLVRLVCPPGGTVLDPFMGSGSTGCAAMYEGFNFVGIEQDPRYLEIARQRITYHELKARGGMVNPFTQEAPAPKPTETEKAGDEEPMDLFDFINK